MPPGPDPTLFLLLRVTSPQKSLLLLTASRGGLLWMELHHPLPYPSYPCSERKPKLCTSPLPYGPPLSECDSAALSPFCFARLRSHRVHPSKPPHSPQSSTPALALVARRYLIRCEFLLMKLIQPSALGRLTHSSNDLFYLCGNRLSRVK